MGASRYDEFDLCRIRVYRNQNGLGVQVHSPYTEIVAGVRDDQTVEGRIAVCLNKVAEAMHEKTPELAMRMTASQDEQ